MVGAVYFGEVYFGDIPPTQTAFAFEGFLTHLPEQPRIRYQPRIGWQISQTTHTNAPFSIDMVAGWKPDRPRPPFRTKVLGWWWYTQFTASAFPSLPPIRLDAGSDTGIGLDCGYDF